jgi:hypothetical protein
VYGHLQSPNPQVLNQSDSILTLLLFIAHPLSQAQTTDLQFDLAKIQ